MSKTPKIHTLETVAYTFKGKWFFNGPNGYTLINGDIKGAEAAHKVAKAIVGGLKRTKGNGIDGLARKAIEMVNQ